MRSEGSEQTADSGHGAPQVRAALRGGSGAIWRWPWAWGARRRGYSVGVGLANAGGEEFSFLFPSH